MSGEVRAAARPAPVCLWCGRELAVQEGRGRKRKYCGQSCKQRAYEQRHNLSGAGIAEGSVILRPERVAELRDELFELRCAAEDVRTAAGEGADPEEIRHLCDELVAMAIEIEKLR
ncbi:hypothetical protein JKI95_00795 [Corynebacterium aquatimens]|uniref:hypothetical protein n=1 Tax=Corynebacterium TaxID=1716 RepID=UPI001F2A4D95|nr:MULTISPECIES: hypothetical protein [Corynebacterium]QYH19753.1 hypothetical protein JKI95_00795 [Corynebacterium aquatimens]UIZ93132.1 hypothetical protein JZY91_05275 [Corynebacterium sp. CNCTC7651]